MICFNGQPNAVCVKINILINKKLYGVCCLLYFKLTFNMCKEMNHDKEVRIGDKVWIGSNVVIMKGTQIPDNCVVGACGFVSGSKFNPYTIILGSPVKSVKKIGGWNL